jgi:hydroxymethyl cephem carbamoyltransferase
MGARAVLAFNPGHDGAFALVADGELVYSLEAEKDSFERHDSLTGSTLLQALCEAPVFPDVIAMGGWHKLLPGWLGSLASGYHGTGPGILESRRVLGRKVSVYSSSHERSHLLCGLGLSPFGVDGEAAVLVWEGVIGALYHWRGPHRPVTRHDVLDQSGARWSALYCLADPSFPASGRFPPSETAGKLMALAGLADGTPPAPDTVAVVDSLLRIPSLYPFHKARYRRSGLYDCGVTDPEVCRAARLLSDRIFEIYRAAACRLFEPGRLPLVIAGGCGLNCDWNSAWRSSGLFTDVFVPPCADDSGSAIGTAIDAAVQLGATGRCEWDVYRGAEFVHDRRPADQGWTARPLDPAALSDVIDEGAVVAWVQGRCEIGPRALGNRSLLASAADPRSHQRLNTIKQREPYRPIAPVCLDEDLGHWFDRDHPDPYMLFFRQVREERRSQIPSVTHADGSARAQSVTARSHPALHRLLTAHRARTGVGVLCNTSLNFSGRGFINRTSDLLHYCEQVGIDHVVIDDQWYERPVPREAEPADALTVGVR